MVTEEKVDRLDVLRAIVALVAVLVFVGATFDATTPSRLWKIVGGAIIAAGCVASARNKRGVAIGVGAIIVMRIATSLLIAPDRLL